MIKPTTRNTIEIFEEISPDLALRIKGMIDGFSKAGTPTLTVLINSKGGCILSGLSIFEAIKGYKGNTVGRVVGVAESMAVIVLQACKERHCCKTGHILIHHMRPSFNALSNFKTDKEEEAYFAELERHNDIVLGILSERTKKPRSMISIQCDTDKPLSPKKEIRLNLIDLID